MAPVMGVNSMLGEALEVADTLICREAERAGLSPIRPFFSSSRLPAPPAMAG